jgi:hypothetical protein
MHCWELRVANTVPPASSNGKVRVRLSMSEEFGGLVGGQEFGDPWAESS